MICILPFHKHEKVNADDESKTNNKENAIRRTGHMEDVTLSFFLLLQTSIQIKDFIQVSISAFSWVSQKVWKGLNQNRSMKWEDLQTENEKDTWKKNDFWKTTKSTETERERITPSLLFV